MGDFRTRMSFGLEPFNPEKHKPQNLGYDGVSTERILTETDEDGLPFNFPSVWFNSEGAAVELPREDARTVALAYEKQSGSRFPRFDRGRFDIGTEMAMHRSAQGGATKGLLAK